MLLLGSVLLGGLFMGLMWVEGGRRPRNVTGMGAALTSANTGMRGSIVITLPCGCALPRIQPRPAGGHLLRDLRTLQRHARELGPGRRFLDLLHFALLKNSYVSFSKNRTGNSSNNRYWMPVNSRHYNGSLGWIQRQTSMNKTPSLSSKQSTLSKMIIVIDKCIVD